MSVLDEIMAEAGSDVLLTSLGDPCAALIYPMGGQGEPSPIGGIVGALRAENRDTLVGGQRKTELYESCQLTVDTAIYQSDQLGIRTKIVLPQYTTGDASNRDQQAFVVRSIDSVTGSLVTVTVERKQLARLARRGNEQ